MERLLTTRLSAIFLIALAGCGSQNSTAGPIPSAPPAATPTNRPSPSPQPTAASAATATVSFKVPLPPATTSSGALRPQYISPGSNFLNILIDGTLAFSAVQIYTYTNRGQTYSYTSDDKNTTATLSGTISGAYFVWTLAVDTLPGKHTFGVNITGNIPPIVLSEGQATYTLAPGPNTAQNLSLNGVLGSYYIQCDTPANIALNNGCAGSFDPTTGSYTLTAVAADFEGFPIPNQNIPFDNGTFTVVETSATKILTLTNAGPFAQPGTQLLGPSGSWYVPGTFAYGQPFQVKCNALGTATLALSISGNGPTNPLTGFTYAVFPEPSPVQGSNYPGAGVLPAGSKTSNSHGNQNVVTNLSSVSCDANLNLTLN
jgi:hypothetical protein